MNSSRKLRTLAKHDRIDKIFWLFNRNFSSSLNRYKTCILWNIMIFILKLETKMLLGYDVSNLIDFLHTIELQDSAFKRDLR